MDDKYLYKSFRLTRVNTAQDLKQKVSPLVSISVLAGGLAIAVVLFLTHRAIVIAENFASPEDSTTQETSAE